MGFHTHLGHPFSIILSAQEENWDNWGPDAAVTWVWADYERSWLDSKYIWPVLIVVGFLNSHLYSEKGSKPGCVKDS